MLVFPSYQVLFAKETTKSFVTTDLKVHYDFSNTDTWNRNKSSNAADYTVNNLVDDYNDAVFRHRTGTAPLNQNIGNYSSSSDSNMISFDSSDGGGCLKIVPSDGTSNVEWVAILIPGSWSHGSGYAVNYNISGESSSSSNNLLNGVGTGGFTYEIWRRFYIDLTDEYYQRFLYTQDNINSYKGGWLYGPAYNPVPSYQDKMRVGYRSGGSWQQILGVPYSGYPPSSSGWTPWLHIVATRTSTSANGFNFYVNNSLISSGTNSNNYTYSKYVHFGDFTKWPTPDNNQQEAKLGLIRYYKKGLTSSEVTQNWKAQKARFGH